MRNHGRIMDIKMTAPRMAESVFVNIRRESGSMDKTLAYPEKRQTNLQVNYQQYRYLPQYCHQTKCLSRYYNIHL